ncbi:hypothetical protein Tco_0685606, partial [Tanacetum coccineum]
MKMSNTIIEDLLSRCLKIKEIIDASIARIDSIRNDKAEEETGAKEAKESSYEGADNIIGKENGSKKEKNKQPKVGPTRVLVVCWEKFVAARGTNRTHKLTLASDFQEGLIRPLIFWKNSQNNTMATTTTTWCPQKGFNEEHGIREFRIIQSNTLRTSASADAAIGVWDRTDILALRSLRGGGVGVDPYVSNASAFSAE